MTLNLINSMISIKPQFPILKWHILKETENSTLLILKIKNLLKLISGQYLEVIFSKQSR